MQPLLHDLQDMPGLGQPAPEAPAPVAAPHEPIGGTPICPGCKPPIAGEDQVLHDLPQILQNGTPQLGPQPTPESVLGQPAPAASAPAAGAPAPGVMSPGDVSTWPGGVAADCGNAVYAAHYNMFCAAAPGAPQLANNPYENGTSLSNPALKPGAVPPADAGVPAAASPTGDYCASIGVCAPLDGATPAEPLAPAQPLASAAPPAIASPPAPEASLPLPPPILPPNIAMPDNPSPDMQAIINGANAAPPLTPDNSVAIAGPPAAAAGAPPLTGAGGADTLTGGTGGDPLAAPVPAAASAAPPAPIDSLPVGTTVSQVPQNPDGTSQAGWVPDAQHPGMFIRATDVAKSECGSGADPDCYARTMNQLTGPDPDTAGANIECLTHPGELGCGPIATATGSGSLPGQQAPDPCAGRYSFGCIVHNGQKAVGMPPSMTYTPDQ